MPDAAARSAVREARPFAHLPRFDFEPSMRTATTAGRMTRRPGDPTMNLLLDRPSATLPPPGSYAGLLLATGALALMLLIAMPWSVIAEPSIARQPAAHADEPTLFEQVRHEVVTGA
jgi:hypothetical protein